MPAAGTGHINDTFAVLDSYHAPFDEASAFDRVVYQSLIGYDQVTGKQLNILAKSLKRLNGNTLEVELRENITFGLPFDENAPEAEKHLRGTDITIDVDLNSGGDGTATIWSCDLTAEYVKINGEYRT